MINCKKIVQYNYATVQLIKTCISLGQYNIFFCVFGLIYFFMHIYCTIDKCLMSSFTSFLAQKSFFYVEFDSI
jgi:hypothetical protein